jgi:glutathione S-transferase
MAPRLYCCPESGNCYKVRLLGSLLAISLEKVEVDLFNMAHKSPDFLAINPKGEIPALVDGDKIFADSSAILVYLAGTHPDRGSETAPSSYWSSDVIEQAQIVDWLAFAATYIHSGLSKARAMVSFNWPANASEETINEARSRGVASLEILEKRLHGKDWLTLGRPTIADVSVYVYVALAPMGGVSLKPFPAVTAWLDRVMRLPGYIGLDGLDAPRQKK